MPNISTKIGGSGGPDQITPDYLLAFAHNLRDRAGVLGIKDGSLLLTDFNEFSPRLSVPAQSAVWSPDGRYLALAGNNSSAALEIYDWNTGLPVAIPSPSPLQSNILGRMAWSPSGRYLAVPGNVSPFLTIYDWDTGSPVDLGLAAQPQIVRCAAWSPDSRYLVIGYSNGTTQTYDWDTGSPVALGSIFSGMGASNILDVAWSHDGQYVAIAHNGTGGFDIFAFNSGSPSNGGFPTSSFQPNGTVFKAAWHPTERYLALAHSGSAPGNGALVIYDWRTANQNVLITLPAKPHTGSGRAVAWSPDGAYLAFGMNQTSQNDGLQILQFNGGVAPAYITNNTLPLIDDPNDVAWCPVPPALSLLTAIQT